MRKLYTNVNLFLRVESFESFEKNSQWDTKSLDLNNFQIKTNLKKVKTLKGRTRNYLQNSVFTFLKCIFIWKLFKSKLLVSH